MDIPKSKIYFVLMDKTKQLIVAGIKPRVLYRFDEPYDVGQVLYDTERLAENAIYKVYRSSDLADEYFEKTYGISFPWINHRDHKKYFIPVPVRIDFA